ncbi:hypothetical protein [Dyadobacter pollutisoli]|jgi:hypothetical protein|uniref:Uncharacterized protein n=1 Tax=Dyadobacter pollutisoli TaxID=2910158 RepID=A0A9E8N9Q8_9BACT|nr:hypothetical protein [Dyadobacter pollutisoli]WAC12580.1 hypothetical protein ON006_01175 [Dyadobacter pollutisoli]
MKMENEKHSVISLSDESFKHYLIERYADTQDEAAGKEWQEGSQVIVSPENWIRLFNKAKADLAKKGGSVTGYELVNNVLLSHDGIHAHWPMNWMWVLQFSHD